MVSQLCDIYMQIYKTEKAVCILHKETSLYLLRSQVYTLENTHKLLNMAKKLVVLVHSEAPIEYEELANSIDKQGHHPFMFTLQQQYIIHNI